MIQTTVDRRVSGSESGPYESIGVLKEKQYANESELSKYYGKRPDYVNRPTVMGYANFDEFMRHGTNNKGIKTVIWRMFVDLIVYPPSSNVMELSHS